MSEYKAGYKSEVARYELIPGERKLFEEHIMTRELIDLAGRIKRGEPHEVNPNYGGQGYTYLYPESEDLGRVKVERLSTGVFPSSAAPKMIGLP